MLTIFSMMKGGTFSPPAVINISYKKASVTYENMRNYEKFNRKVSRV
jgi:hypothetical protein